VAAGKDGVPGDKARGIRAYTVPTKHPAKRSFRGGGLFERRSPETTDRSWGPDPSLPFSLRAAFAGPRFPLLWTFAADKATVDAMAKRQAGVRPALPKPQKAATLTPELIEKLLRDSVKSAQELDRKLKRVFELSEGNASLRLKSQ
jgi:hypothetical protein